MLRELPPSRRRPRKPCRRLLAKVRCPDNTLAWPSRQTMPRTRWLPRTTWVGITCPQSRITDRTPACIPARSPNLLLLRTARHKPPHLCMERWRECIPTQQCSPSRYVVGFSAVTLRPTDAVPRRPCLLRSSNETSHTMFVSCVYISVGCALNRVCPGRRSGTTVRNVLGVKPRPSNGRFRSLLSR